MRRGKKKQDEPKSVEDPRAQDDAAVEEPKREAVVSTEIKVDDTRKKYDPTRNREPIYVLPEGGAMSCRGAIIDFETIHRPGDEPGQIRPEYVIRGIVDLEYWVKAGKLIKK